MSYIVLQETFFSPAGAFLASVFVVPFFRVRVSAACVVFFRVRGVSVLGARSAWMRASSAPRVRLRASSVHYSYLSYERPFYVRRVGYP